VQQVQSQLVEFAQNFVQAAQAQQQADKDEKKDKDDKNAKDNIVITETQCKP
jgi:sRNA-binding protein